MIIMGQWGLHYGVKNSVFFNSRLTLPALHGVYTIECYNSVVTIAEQHG